MYQYASLSARQREALRDLAERGPRATAPQRTWAVLLRTGAIAHLSTTGSRYVTNAGRAVLALIEEAERNG